MEPRLICAVSVHMLKGDGTMPHKEPEANTWMASWIEVWGNPIVEYAFSLVLSKRIAQDVSQETFRRLLKAHQQDPDRALDPAWLFSVTRMLALSRKPSLRSVMVDDDDQDVISNNTNRVWQQMDPLDREAVWLFYYQRWPIKRIALHADQTIEAVQSRLLRAQQRLKGLS